MKKIRVAISVPDNDCKQCPYYGYSYRELSYQSCKEEHYCKLFGNVDLKKKDDKYQRCVACQSCEVDE